VPQHVVQGFSPARLPPRAALKDRATLWAGFKNKHVVQGFILDWDCPAACRVPGAMRLNAQLETAFPAI